MAEIRALSIRQPWAWAIAIGEKPVENRTWETGYRGLLAIHASMTVDRAGLDDPLILQAICDRGFTIEDEPSKQGAVIAVAELYGCHRSPDSDGLSGCRQSQRSFRLCSDWARDGQFHWRLSGVRPLAESVPCKGRLGLWRLPEDVEKAVRAQLEVSGA